MNVVCESSFRDVKIVPMNSVLVEIRCSHYSFYEMILYELYFTINFNIILRVYKLTA